ncbi:hypothetical protein EDB83DRAFT_2319801 [Lactarius deliciosus]|nr:hypothetical protein EDB83DRAFT_2319801 [Lactarius deliciosus]
MSHGYSLRPNAKGRMEKRLNAYVAAFGEENKNNIVAAPSETGEGIRLVFDREHSLAPVPGGPIEQGHTPTSEDVIIIDDSDSDSGSADCDSDSGSESDTSSSTSPQTPPRVHFEPTSALRTPRPQRHGEQRQEDWREGSVASSVSVADSMASLVERGRVLRSQLQDVQAGRRRVEEQRRAEGQRIRVEQIHRLFEEQERSLRERLAALQQEYEQVIAQLDEEGSEGFSVKEESETESNFEYTPTETSESGQQRRRSPTPWPYPGRENRQKSLTPWAEPGNVPPNVRFASPSLSPSSSPPPVAGPSHMGPSMMEQHRQEQSSRSLRRQHAQHMFVSPHKYSSTGGGFVTVTQRVQKLGPSGTAVFNAYTNEPVVETKHYRVRADVLQGIDEDSDMEDL